MSDAVVCSFCRKANPEVETMIKGPLGDIAICDECTQLCAEIIVGRRAQLAVAKAFRRPDMVTSYAQDRVVPPPKSP